MDILYSAYLGTNGSWALVGRYTIRELIKLGHRVKASSTNGWSETPADISSLNSTSLQDPIFLGYTIPSRLQHLGPKTRFLIYNYESSLLPTGWSALINRNASLVLPASQYCADVMKNCGVNSDKIRIFPYGVDPLIFKPGLQPKIPKDKFNFLYCAIPHARKGIDLLFRAYLSTFRGKSDVRLILKTGSHTDRRGKPVFMIDVTEVLENIKKELGGTDFPEVMIMANDFDSPTVARIYNSAHAYVTPSRSEGFGMTPLEAMACGVPVIATAYSAHLDFLNDKNSYLVETREVHAPASMQYWQYQSSAVVGEPNIEQLSAHMKALYDKDGQDPERIAAGLRTANEFTWAKSVKKLEQHMLEYLSGKADPNVRHTRSAAPAAGITVTRERESMARGTPGRLDRPELRMRKDSAGPRTREITTSIKHSQKQLAAPEVPPQVSKKIQQRPAQVSQNNVSPVSTGSALSASRSDFKHSHKRMLFFTAGLYNDLLAGVYAEAINAQYTTTLYAPTRPAFMAVSSDFVQAERRDFIKYVSRLPRGTTIVGDNTAFSDIAFVTSLIRSAGGKLYCCFAGSTLPAAVAKYQNIVILYHSIRSNVTVRDTDTGHIWCDISSGMTGVFDNEVLPGGILI
jgi:glycosyltransferase involved in cell wall biosynthesis